MDIAGLLERGGCRLGSDAQVLGVGVALHLPHSAVEVQSVVADSGMLAALYRVRSEAGFHVALLARRGPVLPGGARGFSSGDGSERVYLTLNPGEGQGGPLTLEVSEQRTPDGATGSPLRTGGAALEVPLPSWRGETLGTTGVEGARVELAHYGFGGLGGRVTAILRGSADTALTLGRPFEAMWLPNPPRPDPAPVEPLDSALPPLERPGTMPPPDLSLVSRDVFHHGQIGIGGRYGREIEDPDRPTLTYRAVFTWPVAGRPDLVCTPTVWRRIPTTFFTLRPTDIGRSFRVRLPGGPSLHAAVTGAVGESALEWAVRCEQGWGLRPGVLHRTPERSRASRGRWSATPAWPDATGWYRGESPLVGTPPRAELACVALGHTGPALTFAAPSSE